MTKEERKAFGAMKKDFNKIVRPLAKSYGFKTAGGRSWSKQGDLLFIMTPILSRTDKIFLHTVCRAKPLFADDYFWDILGLEECKQGPFSLRVTGAYTVQGIRFYSNDHLLRKFDGEEIEKFVREELVHFSQQIQSVSPEGLSWFYQLEADQDRYWQRDVMRLILLLHQGKKDKAREYLNEHEMNDFMVDGKSFGEMAAEYLKRDA